MTMAFGIFFYTSLISAASALTITTDTMVLAMREKRRKVLSLMSFYGVPWTVQKQAFTVLRRVCETNESDYTDVMEAMPSFLRDQLQRYIKVKLVRNVRLFDGASEDCYFQLADCLKQEFCPPYEYILLAGTPTSSTDMYFLNHGVVEILGWNEDTGEETWITNLKDGAWFGEQALLGTAEILTTSVRAITACDLYRMSRTDMQKVMKKFPQFAKKMRDTVERRKQFTSVATKVTDAVNDEKLEEAAKENPDARMQLVAHRAAESSPTGGADPNVEMTVQPATVVPGASPPSLVISQGPDPDDNSTRQSWDGDSRVGTTHDLPDGPPPEPTTKSGVVEDVAPGTIPGQVALVAGGNSAMGELLPTASPASPGAKAQVVYLTASGNNTQTTTTAQQRSAVPAQAAAAEAVQNVRSAAEAQGTTQAWKDRSVVAQVANSRQGSKYRPELRKGAENLDTNNNNNQLQAHRPSSRGIGSPSVSPRQPQQSVFGVNMMHRHAM
eukprot:NODE_408_length_1980_cov_84.809498_g401_i0.p1 GENE.NODE_408_length_1980_cov_84.809498_g401_i0~~NODE_408_length_1980_cov_84.809498_g401_i0.p1  ORF type:complete len:564 (-),score=142.95 NODE_408_length_1980_cov_84.809498_g401_i0:288-1781(-)